MRFPNPLSVTFCLHAVVHSAAAAVLQLNISAITSGTIESDWTTTYHPKNKRSPSLLITNDGGASTGGYHVFDIDNGESDSPSPLEAVKDQFTGRNKLVSTIYDIDGKDYLVSIPKTTSIFSFHELPSFTKKQDVQLDSALGDWSALCPWSSATGNTYLFLLGKREGIQYLVRKKKHGEVQLMEIQTFELPFEFSGCAASAAHSKMFLTPDDGNDIYWFDLAESTQTPEITVFGEVDDDLTGVTIYSSKKQDYVFAAQGDVIEVYEIPRKRVGMLQAKGLEDIEVQGLHMHQQATSRYPQGVLAYALEADDFQGFGISSLEGTLRELGIELDPKHDPRHKKNSGKNPIRKECSYNGFLRKSHRSKRCDCFAGTAGPKCQKSTCPDDCSCHGTCVGPNTCQCDKSWGGRYCGFLLVEPKYETEANGPDGDDPAIWISPRDPELSRIVTTTKSDADAGLGVFDLTGKQLQMLPASQPNNVDIIYGFDMGDNRTVDLAYAACRGDNTLCIFEMTPHGRLKDIPGGIQPSDVEDELYGSCVYRSKKTGKQYLFANEKSARYMQYELTATANGTLSATLVREFIGGSGGQVEGCVTDEDNGWLILGEEPSALWRYDAEPDGDEEGYRIAFVGDGHLRGDVEGVTLVHGKTKNEGFIIVSCQGVSAYNVYRRAAPHDFVMTFTVTDSAAGNIDHITNTDGLAAVGAALSDEYPHGVLVVHDDTNELPGGGADVNASYKIIPLDRVLGAPALAELNLLGEVDENWNPRY